jgi:hypothetical protein
MSQMHIDGRWMDCQSTEEFGKIGVREICDFGVTPGQPHKKLLIRRISWPQAAAPGSPPLPLTVQRVAEGAKLGWRPALDKTYHLMLPQSSGPAQPHPCRVYQQDVTDLVPFKQAVLQALREGRLERFLSLFLNACSALEELGKTCGATGQPVPLQLPESLAVGPAGQVIPLDAEIRLGSAMPAGGAAGQLYQSWFGSEGGRGLAGTAEASVLHVRALRAFMQQLLGQAGKQVPASAAVAPAQIMQRMTQLNQNASLDDFDDWIRQNAGRWELTIEEPAAASPTSQPAPRPPAGPPPIPVTPASAGRTGPLLRRASLVANAVLLLILLLLLILWPRGSKAVPGSDGTAGDGKKSAPLLEARTLLFSSYCVVFPIQGTISDKVRAALDAMLPGKVVEIRRNPSGHDSLLNDKLAQVIKGLPDPDPLKKLLLQLATDKAIRFKGYSASEPNESLSAIIENGGIFSHAGPVGETHGSLLQPDGLDRVLKQAGLGDQPKPRKLLNSLKDAVVEYASLKDALSIIGDRGAFMIQVEPTAAAHEKLRQKLLDRQEKPVFVSRPIPELFDSVDPTADTGEGSAEYSLRLDRKCYWRQASLQDRRNVNYAKNTSNERMKWRLFEAGKRISWQPIPLTRTNGRTQAVTSFDIAVVLQDRVVVFRNQTVLVDFSRKKVLDQGQTYITEGLGLKVRDIQEYISVVQGAKQFTGALKYSNLADLVTEKNTGKGGDVEIHRLKDFDALKTSEDNF